MSAAAPISGDRFTALVLAADRGPDDPVARAGGKSSKCLVPVAGIPMLQRVVCALDASPWIDRIAISLGDTGLLAQLGGLKQPVEDGRVAPVQAQSSPSLSVRHGADNLSDPFPLLVTTADHALLSTEMVDYFCARSRATGADLCAGVTARTLIRARYPQSSRTYLKFRDEQYSGSNLFAIVTPDGLKAVDLWRAAERHRKRPWRLAGVFGPGFLLNYLLGRLSLDDAMSRAGGRLDIGVAAIKMPFAEAAIDVDKPEDLDLVEEILRISG